MLYGIIRVLEAVGQGLHYAGRKRNCETKTGEKAGIYESIVQKITEWVKPYLHRRTEAFCR